MPAQPPPDLVRDRFRARLAADVIGYATGLTSAHILVPGRGRDGVPSARHLVMYLLGSVYTMSITRIAEVMMRDRSTVAYGLRRVEDQRDDPGFDTWVEALEETLRAAPEPPERIVAAHARALRPTVRT